MATVIQAERREIRPRSILTRLRREGRIPGVLYGKGLESVPIHVDGPEFIRFLQREGIYSIFELQLPDGTKKKVFIKELQQDRIKDRILHVDFKEVKMDEPIDTETLLELDGEPVGVKEGGILQQQLRTVEIRALPDKIPSSLTLDIRGLGIGESVTLKDLELPEGVELLSDPEEVVASVLPPQVGQATEEGTETDAAAAEADAGGAAEGEAEPNQE